MSSTEITAVSPPWVSGNAIAEVTVETRAATSANAIGASFIYEPTVTMVQPAYGPAAGGTTVTITGEAFEGHFENGAALMPPFVESVRFGSHHAASFNAESQGKITAVSPPGAGTADVTVTTLGGTSAASPADHFAYATAWPTGPPVIEGESVSHVTSTDAILEARINTRGLETSYDFYIAEERCLECESLGYLFPIKGGELFGSIVPQSVSVDLNSAGTRLLPGYKVDSFWVSATNAAGTTQGAVHHFSPQEPPPLNHNPNGTTPPGRSAGTVPSQAPGSSAQRPPGFSGVKTGPGPRPPFRHPRHHRRRHHGGRHHARAKSRGRHRMRRRSSK